MRVRCGLDPPVQQGEGASTLGEGGDRSGLVIDAGFGCTAPNWVGAALAVSALVPAFLSTALERKGSVPSTVVAAATAAEQWTSVPR